MNQSFLSENFQILEVKFSIYLNMHVFVMMLLLTKILPILYSENAMAYIALAKSFIRPAGTQHRNYVNSTLNQGCFNVVCPLYKLHMFSYFFFFFFFCKAHLSMHIFWRNKKCQAMLTRYPRADTKT